MSRVIKHFTNLVKSALLIVAIALAAPAKADHNAGGELTWKCIKSGTNAGQFVFTLKLYRYCEGIPLGSSAFLSSTSPVTSLTLSRTSTRDVSPGCYLGQEIDCYNTAKDGFAIEEHVYVSSPITITGVPPAAGWEFRWSSCCRPAPAIYNWGQLVDNLHPQNQSYRVKAVMFPYNNTNTSTCYDSSPVFAEAPATIICSDYTFNYNHNAVDEELDSLYYEWTTPFLSNGNPVTYATHTNTSQTTPRANGGGFIVPSPGFSSTVPLPWSHNNMNINNIAASLNPNTGEIDFRSFTKGQYATAVKVSAYKCNIKVAEIYRDIPITLLACPPTASIPPLSNAPPIAEFRWCASCPAIPLPAGDTVYAGDYVEFLVRSNDVQFRPPGFTGQINYLYPSASQFGTGLADSLSGCPYPPCATMDTTGAFWVDSISAFAGQFGLTADFKWKTDCNHISQTGGACFTPSNTYNFLFKVLDDWCPAPGATFLTFAVTVKAPPALEPPKLTCAQVQPNGNVLLKWTQPVTSLEDTLESFRKYIIYRNDSATGQFDTLHIVQDIDSLEFMDNGANAFTVPKYYYIQGISSCNDQSQLVWSDTIGSMILTANAYNSGNSIALNWNDFGPQNKFGSKTTGEYYVWQIYNGDTTLVDTTSESYDSLDINLCYPSFVEYYITVDDTTANFGCQSISSLNGDSVGDILPPDPIVLDSLSFDTTNTLHMGWQASSPDVFMYYIYKQGVLIDSVPAPLTTYSYVPSSTDPNILNFAISAKDSCGNENTVGIGQNAMHNESNGGSLCELNKNIKLAWNLYNPSWANGNGYQEIWRSANGGPFVLIDTVIPLNSTYSDTSIQANTQYRYRVKSKEINTGRSAWSKTFGFYISRFTPDGIVDPVDMRCISWLDSNTVRLEWKRPNNPDSNLNKYFFYHSNSGSGPWTLVDSIKGLIPSDNLAYDSIGYNISGMSPTQSNFFYIESLSGCYGDTSNGTSSVFQAIDLQVNGVSDSVNQLSWNKVTPTQLANQYEIHRDGFGNQIGTSTFNSESYSDKMISCYRQVEYQIVYEDGSVPAYCSSLSLPMEGTFEDDTPPSKQFLDSVSVRRSSGAGLVGWSPNPQRDIDNYYVFECLNGSYSILDTVSGSGLLFFEDFENAPLEGVKSYSVAAVDSCGNNNLASQDFNCHSIIYPKAIMDGCDRTIRLNWNEYDAYASGPEVEYRVFVEVNASGQYTEAGRTKEAKFAYEDIVNGNEYCFYIQAFENDGNGPFTSSSAEICIEAEFIQPPEFAYMKYVTVHEDNTVRMCMQIDLESDIDEYWIKRSVERDENYKIVSTIPLPEDKTQADSVFCYEDKEVVNDRSYYYKIDVIDPCGAVGLTSNIGRTIHLEVSANNEENTNVLTWNQYEEWQDDVFEYKIFRGYDDQTMQLVRSIPLIQIPNFEDVRREGENFVYIDDVSADATSGNGQFCYQVVAFENPSNTFRGKGPESSKSNIECTIQNPLFYVPTAFSPNGDGLNDKFLPYGSFHDLKAYKLEIFNRWGEMIYETEDYQNGGWDGTFNGQKAPTGAYVYIVTFSSADGVEYEKRGTISLTR